jgi:sulfide:quinone oxidoreductase
MTAAFKTVTDQFSVAPQLSAPDIARAAAAGYRTLVCNRPDGEAPGQLTMAEAATAAAAAGMAFHALAFAGPPPPAAVDAFAHLLDGAKGPVLAYCRSGTRSITVWALAQALAGARTPEDLLALTRAAGYDLGALREALKGLYPG